MEIKAKYICIRKCPELESRDITPCTCHNPVTIFPQYLGGCPCGKEPIWALLTTENQYLLNRRKSSDRVPVTINGESTKEISDIPEEETSNEEEISEIARDICMHYGTKCTDCGAENICNIHLIAGDLWFKGYRRPKKGESL